MMAIIRLFVLSLSITCSLSFGLGIDFGGEFNKATMILPSTGFVMVETVISKRKASSMVAFCDQDRYLDSQAMLKFIKPNCESYHFLNRFFEGPGSVI